MYNKDYDKFKFLQKKLFTVTNLGIFMNNKKRGNEDRALSIFFAMVAITVIVYVYTARGFMKLTTLGMIPTICIYASVSIFICMKLISIFSLDMEQKVLDRTKSGENNIKLDISGLWNISPGGIVSGIELNNSETIMVKYSSNAIILRGILRGTIDENEGMDLQHYSVLQKIIDLSVSLGYSMSPTQLKYDVDNDPIWESEVNKIEKASYLGSKYTNMRNTLHTQVYNYTKDNSSVKVVYYILKSTPTSKCSPSEIAVEVQKLQEQCCMNISGINTKEFKNLLEQYYGINISLEDITGKLTLTTEDLGECKLISYIDKNNILVKVGQVSEYEIPTIFTTIGINSIDNRTDDINNMVNKDIIEEEVSKTIFERDII